jgi:hypothetical protein
MTGFFDIEKDKIKRLNDEQARELVARLAKAEARERGLPESGITWGGDQRAKDGGVDVRVKLPPSSPNLDFIPRPSTAYQVKAENFPPAKVAGEVAPKGCSRDIYPVLAAENGAYVIVSSRDDCSQSALVQRIDKIDQTLSSLGFSRSIKSDFYCARRLADWASRHPSVATWLRSALGEPLDGWRPYGAWAYKETEVNADYFVDDKVRVFTPDSDIGKSVEEAMSEWRLKLSRPSVSRLIGLSGVGKTRLVQALFDKNTFGSQEVPSAENVIYCDLSDPHTTPPGMIIEGLFASGADTIVVVDNCGPAEHNRLSSIAGRPGSKMRLITIEYDIRDDLTENTSVYRLDGASNDIIKRLLKRNYPVLSDADANRISEYSDGNARVAYALAGTAEKTGDFARLRDEELFNRLFHQKNGEDDGLLRSAEIASLVYSFDGDDTGASSELASLCTLAECSVTTFLRHMSELRRRGLLQSRGHWRAVLPHAIANRLATRALESVPIPGITTTLFTNACSRLRISFTRRMGLLHKSHQAVAIANSLIKDRGELSEVSQFDDSQAQMFTNLAPLAPALVLHRMSIAIEDPTLFVNRYRDLTKFLRLLKSIAYDPEHFKEAAELLKMISQCNCEAHDRKSAAELYAKLFQRVYSGTHAPLRNRVVVFRDLMSSSGEQDHALAIEALGAALGISNLTPDQSSDFGSHPRDYGWRPLTVEQFLEWFDTWLRICIEYSADDKPCSGRIRALLATSLRELWHGRQIRLLLDEVVRMLAPDGNWPEAWCSIKMIIRWDKSELSKGDLARIQDLEQFLRPKDLVTEAVAKVFSRGSSYVEHTEGEEASVSYQKAIEQAEHLGARVAGDAEALNEMLPHLVGQSGGSNTYSFGRGIGKTLADVPELLGRLKGLLVTGNVTEVSLIPVRGIIAGWAQVDAPAVDTFFDQALADDVWSKWFVELQVQSSLDDKAFVRLMDVLRNKRAPIWQFRYLSFGRATDPLTPIQLKSILREIIKDDVDGHHIAINLIGMVIHCANEKDAEYREDLREVVADFLLNLDWSLVKSDHSMIDHYVETALSFALSGSMTENEAGALLSSMIQAGRGRRRRYRGGDSKVLRSFLAKFPRMTMDAIYQPDEDGNYDGALVQVLDQFSDRQETAIAAVSTEDLLEWCSYSPADRFPFAAATCRLFSRYDDDDLKLEISQTALELLKAAPDKMAVVKEFLHRFRPNSWSGNLSQILVQRLPLLKTLGDGVDQEIAAAIADHTTELERWIEIERRREREEERREAMSFE